MAFTLAGLAHELNATLKGEGGVLVNSVASLENAKKGNVSFCNQKKYIAQLQNTRASAVILSENLAQHCPTHALIHPNPYAAYAKAVQLLHPFQAPFSGVHSSVESLSPVPSDVAIDAFVKIGKNVRIGKNVTIFSGCCIADHVKIGDGSILYPNVSIYADCILGNRVIIHSGAVIGADGFGFAPDGKDWLKICQMGAVEIGDDVEIGANTTIDRGTLGNTTIARGCKIDNLVHIAHNCQIGENTVMAACTGIAGSVKIGKHCMLGGAAMVSGHLEIGDDVVISGGSLVMKSILKPGRYTSVFPLDTHQNWVENAAHIRRLDKWMQKIKNLEKHWTDFFKKQ